MSVEPASTAIACGSSSRPRVSDVSAKPEPSMPVGESRRISVEAPFLGSAADPTPLDPAFLGDQLEFLRAYRTCFVHWLRTEGGRSSRASGQLFARLMSDLAHNDDPEGLELVFEEIYGAPLSAEELSDDHLEGRFLEWLEKKRARPR